MSGNVVDTTVGFSKDFRGTTSSSLGNVDAGDEYASSSTTNNNMPKKTKLSYCVGIISVLVIIAGAAALSFGLFTETSTQTAGQSIHQLDTDTELLLGGDEKTQDGETSSHSIRLRRGAIVNRGLDECNCELIRRRRRRLLEEGLAEEEQDGMMMSMDLVVANYDDEGCDCSKEVNHEIGKVGHLCHRIHSLLI